MLNGLWILGGPISYTKCTYETLKQSEKIDPELLVWKTKYRLVSDAKDINKLSPEEIANYLNTFFDMAWFTFPNQEKKLSFKVEPPPTTKVMSLLKIPYIMTIHREDELSNLRTRGFTPFEWQQFAMKNFAGVVVISHQLEAKVKSLNIIPDEKIYYTKLVYPDESKRSNNRKIKITSISRLADEKRQDKVAELANYLDPNIEVVVYGRPNLFNHTKYQGYIDSKRTSWPGEFYPSDVWNILSDVLIGADFDSQQIGDKLQGVTLEFMLSGVVPLVIDDEEDTRWPTLVNNVNCLKIRENELYDEKLLAIAAKRIEAAIDNSCLLDSIRELNYEVVENYRPKAVLPVLENIVERATNGDYKTW